MPNILKVLPIMKTASVLNLCMYIRMCVLKNMIITHFVKKLRIFYGT
jgi:hypothetical protein